LTATIHQPDFMPWLGFFKKISKVDTWIVLDHVTNNPRDAAFWGRRGKILVNGQSYWLSIPLQKPAEPKQIRVPINEMMIDQRNGTKFQKQLKTIIQNYCNAPHFSEVFPIIEEYYSDFSESLCDKNLFFIKRVLNGLKIMPKIVKSSELKVKSSSTVMLVDLLKAINAHCYICGDGAKAYQTDSLFAENNILLKYNNFSHPKYSQKGSEKFIPGLSVIDVLANEGFEKTKELLLQ